jgi:hypothetical protein
MLVNDSKVQRGIVEVVYSLKASEIEKMRKVLTQEQS